MIPAENAYRIMQRYESDYDNFLDKLKAKRRAKKAIAAKTKAQAHKADTTVAQAEAHKKIHLGQKAKNLLEKAGGIQGAKDSIENVMKYIKSDPVPSDYEMSVGQGEENAKAEKKIMGLSPAAVYLGSAVLVLAGLYGLSRYLKNKSPQTATHTTAIPAPGAE